MTERISRRNLLLRIGYGAGALAVGSWGVVFNDAEAQRLRHPAATPAEPTGPVTAEWDEPDEDVDHYIVTLYTPKGAKHTRRTYARTAVFEDVALGPGRFQARVQAVDRYGRKTLIDA